MKCKNTIAMVLAGAMLLPSNAFAADLSQYKDFPNDWSAKSLEQAIDDGLLNGSNGMIDAKGLLTRAQMAAIVSRAFGAAKTASLDDYRDVLPSAWYYSDMGKAVKMGAFQGANGLLNPDAPITREEAFTVLARAFALEGGGSATLKDFVDGGTVSSWASESVAALVAGGYVNGANGMLNLKNNITRAEFAKVITGMAASYVGAEGVSGKTVEGNVIVRESGASLSGMTINGDLIIADSADKVSLDNVKVTGRIVIRGASTEASLKNSSAGKGVLVSNPNGAASLSVSGGSVGTVTAKSDLVVSGSVDNIVIAEKAALTVQSGASVGSVTVSAAGASVSGAGTVSAVQANANNVTVSTKNTKVTAASGVSGVKAGDKTVSSGKTETVGTTTSSGGSSSGGSSSSRSDYSYVLMNIPYDEFYKAELSENAPAVDAVSSATKNKTRNGSLAGGSYHVNRDGSDITGVTYPVRVKTSDLSGLKQVTNSDSVSITVKNKKGEDGTSTYNGREALFESASYSYYALSDTPSYYKEATLTDGKWSFGKATGAASEATATIAKFKAPGHHAKYEMEIDSDKIAKGKKVYAVVLTTTDGNTYGLHHVTEIWHVTKLGFKADPALVGKNISAVTYYTDDGIIKLNLAKELHVPYIAEGAKAEVAKFSADAKETTLTLSGFPDDFSQSVSVPEGMGYNKETKTITFDSALPGSYKVTVSDAKGKYADVTASFTVSTNKEAAQYDSESVSLKAVDGANDAALANYLKNITSVTVGGKEYAATGKKAVTIINSNGYLDLTAEPFADMKSGSNYTITVKANYYKDQEFNVTIPDHIYAYAAVPYDEYWQSEGVYLNEGSEWDVGSDELDGRKEYDKGAFDAVSRATTNHGLHRGSFQQSVVIHTDGRDYHPVSWVDGNTFVDADGQTYDKTKIGITSYKITGIKYVPVQVSSSDFVDFCKHYTVTQNGETLQGGFSENNLNAYTAVAAVDKNTNGLKEVTLASDGYTFGKRQTGTGSGIKGEKLATTADIVTTPARNDASYGATGSYGETVRVNLTGDGYGALGDKMQTVLWEYYGSDSTRTNKVATYGTKFAADNWMHKSMGIQLGLTDSLRCNVSETEGKGIGYWKVTVYALGYEDYSTEFEITADNLPKVYGPITDEQKAQLKTLADKAKKYLDNKATQYPDTVSKETLQAHHKEATDMLADGSAKENEAAELITELTGYLDKMDEANKPSTPTTEIKTATLDIIQDKDAVGTSAKYKGDDYTITVNVTLTDGKITNVSATSTAEGDDMGYFSSLTDESFFNKFKNILSTDTASIDTIDAVSGATYSSATVKQAVKKALSK